MRALLLAAALLSGCATVPQLTEPERQACRNLLDIEADRIDAGYSKLRDEFQLKVDAAFDGYAKRKGFSDTSLFKASFNSFFEKTYAAEFAKLKGMPFLYRQMAAGDLDANGTCRSPDAMAGFKKTNDMAIATYRELMSAGEVLLGQATAG